MTRQRLDLFSFYEYLYLFYTIQVYDSSIYYGIDGQHLACCAPCMIGLDFLVKIQHEDIVQPVCIQQSRFGRNSREEILQLLREVLGAARES